MRRGVEILSVAWIIARVCRNGRDGVPLAPHGTAQCVGVVTYMAVGQNQWDPSCGWGLGCSLGVITRF